MNLLNRLNTRTALIKVDSINFCLVRVNKYIGDTEDLEFNSRHDAFLYFRRLKKSKIQTNFKQSPLYEELIKDYIER